MPQFISVLQSELQNNFNWVFAQEADTLIQLEQQQTFFGLSTILKTTETFKPVDGTVRVITGNAGGGTIAVISHQLVNKAHNLISPQSVTVKKKSTKRQPPKNGKKNSSKN